MRRRLPTAGSTMDVAREVADRLTEDALGSDGVADPQGALERLDEVLRVLDTGVVRTAVIELLLESSAFDLLPLAVQQRVHPDPLRHSSWLEDGRLEGRTALRLAGVEVGEVEAALLERPWHWWRGGRVSGWQRLAEGGADFRLRPLASWLPVALSCRLSTARDEAAADGTRPADEPAWRSMDLALAGSLAGRGRLELLTVGGGVVLRSSWNAVEPRGLARRLPRSLLLRLWRRCQSGELGFPFLRGTGWKGLLDQLTSG